MQTIIQNHCTLKVTNSKKGSIHNIFHFKTILGFEIHAKLLFLHALTRCGITSSINKVGKVTVFKKLLLNNYLQKAALAFTTSSKLHKEMESAEKNVYYLGQHRPLFGKKLQQNSKPNRKNRISFKVS